MSKMQEMAWRKKNKGAAGGAAGGAAAFKAAGAGGLSVTGPEPPPGMTKMQEMAWRKKNKPKI
jgi:hypothetical protein